MTLLTKLGPLELDVGLGMVFTREVVGNLRHLELAIRSCLRLLSGVSLRDGLAEVRLCLLGSCGVSTAAGGWLESSPPSEDGEGTMQVQGGGRWKYKCHSPCLAADLSLQRLKIPIVVV